jgi:hypothetical protein
MSAKTVQSTSMGRTTCDRQQWAGRPNTASVYQPHNLNGRPNTLVQQLEDARK